MANKFEAVVEPENVVVRLEPHTGIQHTRVGPVKRTLDQDVVFINDVWSGYVAHGDNAKLNLLFSDLPDDLVAAVRKQVDELRKEKGFGPTAIVSQTSQLRDNNVVVEQEETLDDEDI